MAEEHREQAVSVKESEGEVKDRGLFDFLGKKETEEMKPEEEGLSAGVHNIRIEEGDKAHEGKEKEEEKLEECLEKSEEKEKEEGKHHGVLDKFQRSHSSSSSSSSSDEEEVEGEGGIKEKIKKKKKVLKEKIEGKFHGGEEQHEEEKKPAFVPSQPVEETKVVLEEFEFYESAVPEEEEKGFLERMKEKLPGHSKKPAEECLPVPHTEAVEVTGDHEKMHDVTDCPDPKEKKGFLEKIKEKLPGYHRSAGEESDKVPASH